MKNDIRFEYVSGKNVRFFSFPLFQFTVAIKLRNFDLKNHWSTWILFDANEDMMSDLNISYGKMSDFVIFSLFAFALVIKLRNFDFESQ